MIAGAVNTGSVIHRFNPAVKLIIFICLMQMTAASSELYPFISFTAVFITLFHISGLKTGVMLKSLKPFFLLLLATFLINLLFGSGLTVSAVLTYKFLLIILFSLLLTVTTETNMMVAALLMPFKGKHGKSLKTVFMVALEFIPVFISESKDIYSSIKDMPDYQTGTYRALFKPELYLKPLTEGLTEKAASTANRVEAGDFDVPAISIPRPWEALIGAASLIMAVKYAL